MAKRTEQAFHKRNRSDSQNACEKVLNIISYQENAIKITMRYH